MLGFQKAKSVRDRALVAALDRSMAMITFDRNGKVLSANENFCRTMGYELGEIVGQHHRIFVDSAYAASEQYQAFWRKLASGEFDSKEYQRVGKGGRPVWIQATYNPVRNFRGRVCKVVKLATDITQEKLRKAEAEAQAAAASGVMMIEFTPTGEILAANSLFLQNMGYTLDEIKGRHHRMCVNKAFGQSEDYVSFWQRLAAGHYVAGEFQRIGGNGREIWIQASYNPVKDSDGHVIKVVKLATDITGRIHGVRVLGAGLAELAANNLAFRIDEHLDSTFEKLRIDYNKAASQLDDVVQGIVSNTKVIGAAVGEIAQASDDLSRRTEQQAASLEQTAAALQEITGTVRQTAGSAKDAGQAMSETRAKADESGRIVQDAVGAMSKISDSARQITQIIGVIDEIAFQTNLLALNAGVEAARAGDAGRGFAVVASEVRALAQRSAEAAKQIKTLISASSQEVGRGVELVGETGRVLHEIADRVVGVDSIVLRIATAAQEQATGLAEVNTAVSQIDQVTQQNAAMVEQSTAATHSVAKETESLTELTGRFRLTATAASGARPPPRTVVNPPPARRAPLRLASQGSRGGASRDQWKEF